MDNTILIVDDEPGIRSSVRGVLADATGMHAWRINPKTVDAVFERLPLLDQAAHLWPTFSAEADRHPQCRGYFAKRYLQFGLMIRMSPWNQRALA